MQVSFLSKAHTILSHFYAVPWCVPAWGREEFRVTVQCILTGSAIQGPHPVLFAEAVKDYLGLRYALPVNRGRVAIELALRAMDLRQNDEVVFPSYVCHSVLDAVLRAGLRPVFADVGPDLHVTVETVKAVITSQTRCVIVPHLFGNTAPVDEIENLLKGTGIALIDDAAQSLGSRRSARLVGTFGECGIVSCGPGKTLAGPAGGLLVTQNRELYKRAVSIPLGQESSALVTRRVLSFWAWRRFRRYTLPFRILVDRMLGPEEEFPSTACEMSNLDGAIALQQFTELCQNSVQRRRNADALLLALGTIADYNISDFSQDGTLVKLVLVLPIKGPTADEVINFLAAAGVECQKGYVPIHQKMKDVSASLPTSEALWNRVVCVPVDTALKNTKRLFRLSNTWPGFRDETRFCEGRYPIDGRIGERVGLVASRLRNDE